MATEHDAANGAPPRPPLPLEAAAGAPGTPEETGQGSGRAGGRPRGQHAEDAALGQHGEHGALEQHVEPRPLEQQAEHRPLDQQAEQPPRDQPAAERLRATAESSPEGTRHDAPHDSVSEEATPADPVGTDELLDEGFIHTVSPIFKLLRLYSRLEVEGLERLPDGPAILVANHTGWLGLDYAYTALSVYDAKKRIVRGLAHRTWFLRPQIGDFAHRLGLFEVNKQTMRSLLRAGQCILLFPEGEKGAFKGEHERYMLQEFARGYVRVALECGVPIVPVAIIGGEEANPSSRRIDSYEDLLNLSLPTPQNLFPRPVKWRISFMAPIRLEGTPEKAGDADYVHRVNDRIRSDLQNEIARLISVRGNPFF